MMRLVTAIVCPLFAICLGFAGDTPVKGTTFGAGVSGRDTVPVGDLLADPERFEGKTVRVEGKVVAVCANMGCWMDIVAGAEGQEIQVKVDDGVIVFPRSLEGMTVIAEGTVEVLDLSREKYETWLKHLADEQGKPFDPATVGSPPYRIVRIRGTGAEVIG